MIIKGFLWSTRQTFSKRLRSKKIDSSMHVIYSHFVKPSGEVCACWLFVAVHPEGFGQRHEQFQRSTASRPGDRQPDGAGSDCHRHPGSAPSSLPTVTHGCEGETGCSGQPRGTPHCSNADDRIRESNLQVLWVIWDNQCIKQHLVNFLLSSLSFDLLIFTPSIDISHLPLALVCSSWTLFIHMDQSFPLIFNT